MYLKICRVRVWIYVKMNWCPSADECSEQLSWLFGSWLTPPGHCWWTWNTKANCTTSNMSGKKTQVFRELFRNCPWGGGMQKVVDFSAASSPLVGLCMQSSMSNISRHGSSLAGEGRSLLQDLRQMPHFQTQVELCVVPLTALVIQPSLEPSPLRQNSTYVPSLTTGTLPGRPRVWSLVLTAVTPSQTSSATI